MNERNASRYRWTASRLLSAYQSRLCDRLCAWMGWCSTVAGTCVRCRACVCCVFSPRGIRGSIDHSNDDVQFQYTAAASVDVVSHHQRRSRRHARRPAAAAAAPAATARHAHRRRHRRCRHAHCTAGHALWSPAHGHRHWQQLATTTLTMSDEAITTWSTYQDVLLHSSDLCLGTGR